jgi:uncharacterized protein (TIGR03067 family)
MKRILWAGLAFATIPLTLPAGDDAAIKKDLKALMGRWKVVALSEGGKEVPKDGLPAITLVCRADGTVTAQRPEGDTEHSVVLDPSGRPKRMVVTDESGSEKGKKQHAIYKLEGGRFTIRAARCGAPEEDRPADFNVRDARARLMVFERVKDD